MLTIGKLGEAAGGKVPTIRYYEQIGLLRERSRSKGNQRRYDHGAVHRLLFIRRARDLGFSIEAIKDLFRLADASFSSPAEALRIAKEQLAAVEEKIAQLETLEKVIQLVAESENDGDLIPLDILPSNDSDRDGDAEVKASSRGRGSIH